MSAENLFSEFKEYNLNQWKELLTKELKGAAYESLFWKNDDGIEIQPLYHPENSPSPEASVPGEFPYLRGGKKSSNSWEIMEKVSISDEKKANEEAIRLLMQGISSLSFEVNENTNFKLLFNDFYWEAISVNLITKSSPALVFDAFSKYAKVANIPTKSIRGSICYAPLSEGITNGKVGSVADLLPLYQLAASDWPFFRLVNIDLTGVSLKGGNQLHELALALSMGVEYLHHLTENGVSVDDALGHFQFTFPIGSDTFANIAKLRAFRTLWNGVVASYQPQHSCSHLAYIHAETALWNIRNKDRFNSVLRATTEAFSAVAGGCDSLYIHPFPHHSEESEFAQRISKNIQLLLKEEVGMEHFIDPTAGSYYVESLTSSLVKESWKLFLEWEESGGYTHTLSKGDIGAYISFSAKEKAKSILEGKSVLVGVNKFQNKNEKEERFDFSEASDSFFPNNELRPQKS